MKENIANIEYLGQLYLDQKYTEIFIRSFSTILYDKIPYQDNFFINFFV
jgi:hypothetical protein